MNDNHSSPPTANEILDQAYARQVQRDRVNGAIDQRIGFKASVMAFVAIVAAAPLVMAGSPIAATVGVLSGLGAVLVSVKEANRSSSNPIKNPESAKTMNEVDRELESRSKSYSGFQIGAAQVYHDLDLKVKRIDEEFAAAGRPGAFGWKRGALVLATFVAGGIAGDRAKDATVGEEMGGIYKWDLNYRTEKAERMGNARSRVNVDSFTAAQDAPAPTDHKPAGPKGP